MKKGKGILTVFFFLVVDLSYGYITPDALAHVNAFPLDLPSLYRETY